MRERGGEAARGTNIVQNSKTVWSMRVTILKLKKLEVD